MCCGLDQAEDSADAEALGWWAWPMPYEVMLCGGRFDRLIGSAKAFNGTFRSFLASIAAEDREQVDASIQLAMLGEDFRGLRFRLHGAGPVRWLEMNGGLRQCAAGQVPRICAVIRDVTSNVAAEHRMLRRAATAKCGPGIGDGRATSQRAYRA